MKILILTLSLFISTHSSSDTKIISCQKDISDPMNSSATFSLLLNNSQIQKDSGYFRIVMANWGFMYSTATRMNCTEHMISLHKNENFKCVGYVNSSWLLEITIKLNKGKGFAKVNNLDDNIYTGMTQGMVLPCHQIKDL